MAGELEILFVDDEDSIRLTFSMMLQSEGFKVSTAASVAEALHLISQRKFDILISDMNIERPGDGFTIVSAMRGTQPKALRFILTGYPDIESALRALREEVDDYLIKPMEIEELVEKLRSKTRSKEHRKPIAQLRLGAMIDREREYINEKWLVLAKEDADLRSLKLSDPERKDHIPQLVDVAVALLEKGKEISAENREVAKQHGETRYKQKYSADLLLRETKLLQDAIASCVHRNLLEIDISTVLPDLVRVFGIIQTLLEESLNAFLREQRTRK